jgi:hypothetical protein
MKEMKTKDFIKIDEASNMIEKLCDKVLYLDLKIKIVYVTCFVLCLIIFSLLFVWPYLKSYLTYS